MPYDSVLLHLHEHCHRQMIVIVRTDTGQVLLHRYPGGVQLVLVPDAREHQQLGRKDRTGGNNDLPARAELPAGPPRLAR